MDRTKVFNEAFQGLKSQGFKKSGRWTATRFKCAYRGESGMRCAIGWLIPDKDYDVSMDINSVSIENLPGETLELIGVDYNKPENEIKDDIEFLSQLQQVHDFNVSDTLEEDLRAFAYENRIEIYE